MTIINPQDLADRYIAMWTEPDAALRRNAIEHLWAEGGTHILQPPVEIREAATALGFGSAILEARVTRSYERFIAPGEYTFQPRDDAVHLHNVVKFTWETVRTDGGEAVSGGLEILVLDDDGRIKADYMFPGP
jgi:hypothetical protein